jgi:hypothetical protein
MSSLDQRCQQFHDVAMGLTKSKGGVKKEMMTLRRFLHNNQEQRFTEKAISRLYDTIQIYCCYGSITNGNSTALSSLTAPGNGVVVTVVVEDEWKEELLEDALKMPFTMFNTKQKQKMIKWLEEIRKNRSSVSRPTAFHNGTLDDGKKDQILVTLSVIDCDEETITCMDDETGCTATISITSSEQLDLCQEIYSTFLATDTSVRIQCWIDNHPNVSDDDTMTITSVAGIC